MKSKDLQKLVLRLYQNGKNGNEIFKDLHGLVSRRTVFYWIKSINNIGGINLKSPKGRPRVIRSTSLIQKVKQRLSNKNGVSARLLSKKLKVSRTTIRRVIKEDLGLKSYVKRVAPKLTDQHKMKRRSFGIWVRKNIRKSMTKKILFSDEKRFDIDGMYNRQNERIYAATREQADAKGGVYRKTKFPAGVMVWLAVCDQGVTRPVVIEEGTIDSNRYIANILPVALKDGKKMLGDQFTYQQDNAKPHADKKTQLWCKNHFFNFWTKDRWPPNSPDLNPLDYCIWTELGDQMNWNKIINKKTLINEIKLGVKKIRVEVVRRSIGCWSNRVYQMLQREGDYVF
jgi:transposase